MLAALSLLAVTVHAAPEITHGEGKGSGTSEYVRVNMSLVVGMSSREGLTPGKKVLMTFAAVGW